MRLRIDSLCALAFVTVLSASASAATDYYLKIEGIEGEAAAPGGGGSLAIASWSFGASNPTSVGSSGMSAGRMAAAADAEPAAGGSGSITVTKTYDKASPKLARLCASGQHIANAQLTRCADGACRSYELRDVLISSLTLANDGGGKATETLSLNYTKIEFKAAPQSTQRESPTLQSTGTTTVPPKKGKPQ
jgi:type VI secretion system secreted protein Hcp